MGWEDDVSREVKLIWDNLLGPGLLYRCDRHFWFDLWRAPVVEAIEEDGLETRLYGPIQAMVYAAAPNTPLLNLMLGAAEPGAVAEGHLAAALDWIEAKGIDCRVPVRPEFEESGAAEDLLNQRGYRRAPSLLKFVRDGSPPDFPEPPGIEVDEWTEETEGFSDYFAEGLKLDSMDASSFFDSLPGRRYWRCYVAIDEDENGTAAATMMEHYEVAQLGFAATRPSAEGKGSHMALLRRRILDATAAGARILFADVEETAAGSIAARNLVRAGFRRIAVQPVWRPPAKAIEPDEEEEEADPDGEGWPELS